jgi:hypothetical protein
MIIKPRTPVYFEKYSLVFDWKDTPGSGFSFPCTKEGHVLTSEMKPAGIENYQKCTDGTYDVVNLGIQNFSYTYNEPAELKCSCDNVVTLESSWCNTCDNCGCEYNGSGQLLAPRSQWYDFD